MSRSLTFVALVLYLVIGLLQQANFEFLPHYGALSAEVFQNSVDLQLIGQTFATRVEIISPRGSQPLLISDCTFKKSLVIGPLDSNLTSGIKIEDVYADGSISVSDATFLKEFSVARVNVSSLNFAALKVGGALISIRDSIFRINVVFNGVKFNRTTVEIDSVVVDFIHDKFYSRIHFLDANWLADGSKLILRNLTLYTTNDRHAVDLNVALLGGSNISVENVTAKCDIPPSQCTHTHDGDDMMMDLRSAEGGANFVILTGNVFSGSCRLKIDTSSDSTTELMPLDNYFQHIALSKVTYDTRMIGYYRWFEWPQKSACWFTFDHVTLDFPFAMDGVAGNCLLRYRVLRLHDFELLPGKDLVFDPSSPWFSIRVEGVKLVNSRIVLENCMMNYSLSLASITANNSEIIVRNTTFLTTDWGSEVNLPRISASTMTFGNSKLLIENNDHVHTTKTTAIIIARLKAYNNSLVNISNNYVWCFPCLGSNGWSLDYADGIFAEGVSNFYFENNRFRSDAVFNAQVLGDGIAEFVPRQNLVVGRIILRKAFQSLSGYYRWFQSQQKRTCRFVFDWANVDFTNISLNSRSLGCLYISAEFLDFTLINKKFELDPSDNWWDVSVTTKMHDAAMNLHDLVVARALMVTPLFANNSLINFVNNTFLSTRRKDTKLHRLRLCCFTLYLENTIVLMEKNDIWPAKDLWAVDIHGAKLNGNSRIEIRNNNVGCGPAGRCGSWYNGGALIVRTSWTERGYNRLVFENNYVDQDLQIGIETWPSATTELFGENNSIQGRVELMRPTITMIGFFRFLTSQQRLACGFFFDWQIVNFTGVPIEIHKGNCYNRRLDLDSFQMDGNTSQLELISTPGSPWHSISLVRVRLRNGAVVNLQNLQVQYELTVTDFNAVNQSVLCITENQMISPNRRIEKARLRFITGKFVTGSILNVSSNYIHPAYKITAFDTVGVELYSGSHLFIANNKIDCGGDEFQLCPEDYSGGNYIMQSCIARDGKNMLTFVNNTINQNVEFNLDSEVTDATKGVETEMVTIGNLIRGSLSFLSNTLEIKGINGWVTNHQRKACVFRFFKQHWRNPPEEKINPEILNCTKHEFFMSEAKLSGGKHLVFHSTIENPFYQLTLVAFTLSQYARIVVEDAVVRRILKLYTVTMNESSWVHVGNVTFLDVPGTEKLIRIDMIGLHAGGNSGVAILNNRHIVPLGDNAIRIIGSQFYNGSSVCLVNNTADCRLVEDCGNNRYYGGSLFLDVVVFGEGDNTLTLANNTFSNHVHFSATTHEGNSLTNFVTWGNEIGGWLKFYDFISPNLQMDQFFVQPQAKICKVAFGPKSSSLVNVSWQINLTAWNCSDGTDFELQYFNLLDSNLTLNGSLGMTNIGNIIVDSSRFRNTKVSVENLVLNRSRIAVTRCWFLNQSLLYFNNNTFFGQPFADTYRILFSAIWMRHQSRIYMVRQWMEPVWVVDRPAIMFFSMILQNYSAFCLENNTIGCWQGEKGDECVGGLRSPPGSGIAFAKISLVDRDVFGLTDKTAYITNLHTPNLNSYNVSKGGLIIQPGVTCNPAIPDKLEINKTIIDPVELECLPFYPPPTPTLSASISVSSSLSGPSMSLSKSYLSHTFSSSATKRTKTSTITPPILGTRTKSKTQRTPTHTSSLTLLKTSSPSDTETKNRTGTFSPSQPSETLLPSSTMTFSKTKDISMSSTIPRSITPSRSSTRNKTLTQTLEVTQTATVSATQTVSDSPTLQEVFLFLHPTAISRLVFLRKEDSDTSNGGNEDAVPLLNIFFLELNGAFWRHEQQIFTSLSFTVAQSGGPNAFAAHQSILIPAASFFFFNDTHARLQFGRTQRYASAQDEIIEVAVGPGAFRGKFIPKPAKALFRIIATPIPKAIPKKVTEDSALAVSVVSSVSGTISAAGPQAAMAARTLAMIAMQSCDFLSDEELSLMQHPTRIPIGSDSYRYFVGASVMNTLLNIALFLLHLLLVKIANSFYKNSSFLAAMATVRFPNIMLVPFLFLLQATLTASLVVLLHSDVQNLRVLCGFILAIWTLIAFGSSYYILAHFGAEFHWYTLEEKKKLKWWFIMFWEGKGRWDEKENRPGFLMRYDNLFNLYTGTRAWFFVIEYLAIFVVGITEAIRPENGDCSPLFWILAAANFLYALATVFLVPYNNFSDVVIMTFFAVCQGVGAVLMLIGFYVPDVEEIQLASAWLLMVGMYALLFKCVIDLFVFIKDVRDRMKEHQQKLGEEFEAKEQQKQRRTQRRLDELEGLLLHVPEQNVSDQARPTRANLDKAFGTNPLLRGKHTKDVTGAPQQEVSTMDVKKEKVNEDQIAFAPPRHQRGEDSASHIPQQHSFYSNSSDEGMHVSQSKRLQRSSRIQRKFNRWSRQASIASGGVSNSSRRSHSSNQETRNKNMTTWNNVTSGGFVPPRNLSPKLNQQGEMNLDYYYNDDQFNGEFFASSEMQPMMQMSSLYSAVNRGSVNPQQTAAYIPEEGVLHSQQFDHRMETKENDRAISKELFDVL